MSSIRAGLREFADVNTIDSRVRHNVAEDLSLNDFIVAAKVNELELASLLKKKRAKFWA